MFFKKMEEAACGWGHYPGSGSGKGVAQHWELLPQSPALTLHIQNCLLVFWQGLGGDRSRYWESALLVHALLVALWVTREGAVFWNGCRDGPAIVSVLTKLWFRSCLADGFLSAGIGIQWMHLINWWFANKSVICKYIVGATKLVIKLRSQMLK